MVKSSQFFQNLKTVLISNFFVLLSSIVTGFVIPKLLGVIDYGYYKTFTLYAGYIPLFHFGFVDGILLLFAGKEYDELDKKKFRTYTNFFTRFQLFISILVLIFSVFFLEGMNKYIFMLLSIDLFSLNVTSYFQYVSQSTMRFDELSKRKILLSILKMILVGIIGILSFILDIKDGLFYVFVVGVVSIDLFLSIWYVFTYKDITCGSRCSYASQKNFIKKIFKVGVVLTISFQISNLIFSLDRQFVVILFDTETYSIYSFAYNLISMVTTVIGAVSLVLLPTLKKKDENEIMSNFSLNMSYITVTVFFCLLGYFPLCEIIRVFLPEYIKSLDYLKILFPGLAMTCCINIIMFTYYKALNKQSMFCKICIFIFIISFILNGVAYIFIGTPASISYASIITLLIWYLVAEIYFIQKYKVGWKKNLLYLLIQTVLFYFSVNLSISYVFSFFLYVIFYFTITIFFFRKEVMYLIRNRLGG